MSDFHEAMAEMDKMTRVIKAFEGARAVFNALANSEQVGRELDAQVVAKRDALAKLTADADATSALITEAQAEAKQVVAKAHAEAEATLAGAQRKAAQIVADGVKEKDEQITALASEYGDTLRKLEDDIATKSVDLSDIEGKIAVQRARFEELFKPV